MDIAEARKCIIKHNKLRKRIERLTDRLWREPINGRGFKICQQKLKEAQNELSENAPKHLKAWSACLSIRPHLSNE